MVVDWLPPIEARIRESERFKSILKGKEYNVPIERLVSELTEAIILGAIERPAKYGGAGVTLTIRAMNSAFVDTSSKPALYWKVSAVVANGTGGNSVWQSEGYDLNQAVYETIGQVPQSVLYPDVFKRGKRRVVRRSEEPTKRVVRRKRSDQSTSEDGRETQQSKRRVVRRRV